MAAHLTASEENPRPFLTANEYGRLPGILGWRDELIEGERVVSPMPKKTHTIVVENLEEILKRQIVEGRVVRESGWFYRSAEGVESVPGPDLLVLSEADYEADSPSGWFEGTPRIVIEVISPSERRQRRLQKIGLYLDAGASWVVEVDLTKRIVLIYTMASEAAEVIRGGRIEKPFAAELSDIFARLPEP